MELSGLIDQLRIQAANVAPFGAKMKFVLDGQSIMIDGHNNNEVCESNDEEEADCTIITSSESLIKMKNGDLNPMMAVMTGKVKIKGDMGLAMKLQGLIG
jgi:putative sterol carrier protein